MQLKKSRRDVKRVRRSLLSEIGEAAEFSLMAMTFVVAIVAAATTFAEAIDARMDVATAVFDSE